MLFIAEKSKHLSMHCKNLDSTVDEITMKGVDTPKVSSHKQLNGLTINNALKWTDNMNNIYSACAQKVDILRRLGKKLHPSVIKRIYTGATRPKR